MDEHLRELERRADLGDLVAAGRLLTEQVRAGDLSGESLALAAELGDPAACSALDRDLPAPTLDALLSALRGSPRLLVRALLQASELCLPRFERWLAAERGPQEALRACAEWLEQPSEERALAAHEAAGEARQAAGRVTYALLPRHQLGILSRGQITALEYVAWTAQDAALGAFRCELSEERPDASSLRRLAEARIESGWDAPGALARELGRGLARSLLRGGRAPLGGPEGSARLDPGDGARERPGRPAGGAE